jgi:molybdopterin synthase sulfur carrier subunit
MIIRYYAWLREKLSRSEDRVSPPQEVASVADLLVWLSRKDPTMGEVMKDPKALRVAIDSRIVPLTAPLGNTEVVALFPPMTGG